MSDREGVNMLQQTTTCIDEEEVRMVKISP